MPKKKIEQQIIENYQNDEKMMILVYAQWCINNNLDPITLYEEAYPNQLKNSALTEALELTVAKEESELIANETLLQILQVYGNDDLAFIVQEKIDLIEKRKKK